MCRAATLYGVFQPFRPLTLAKAAYRHRTRSGRKLRRQRHRRCEIPENLRGKRV